MNRSKYFIHIKTGKKVTISTDETRFHIDGEPVTFSGDVVINVKKDALKVLKTRFNKFAKHTKPDNS